MAVLGGGGAVSYERGTPVEVGGGACGRSFWSEARDSVLRNLQVQLRI